MTPRKLTPKQQRFVNEYLIDLNATRAAIRTGYSPKTATNYGLQLLEKTGVQAAVSKANAQRSQRTQITADAVLSEIAKLAFLDIRALFDENGNLKPLHELSDDAAACLSAVEVVTRQRPGSGGVEVEHVAKVRLWDKRSALELLGRHLKMFTDRLDVGVQEDNPLNLLMQQIMGRSIGVAED